jgi:hypothetical protein
VSPIIRLYPELNDIGLSPLTALLKQSLEAKYTVYMSWLRDYAEIQLCEPGVVESIYHVGGEKTGDFTLIAHAYLSQVKVTE